MKKLFTTSAICLLTSYILFSQPITSVGHKSAFGPASASSVTIAKPTGVQQNDLLLAHISGRVISGFALLPPTNGWTLIRKLNTGSQFGSYCFYKIASASEPANYTFTDSTGAMLYDKLGAISVWRGVNIISPINAEDDTIVNGSPHSTPSITTTVDSCMIVTLFSDGSGSSWTPPSGMMEEYDTAAAQSSWVSDACDYQLQAATGSTGIKTAVPSSNSLATAFIIALQPSSSPTGVSAFYSDASIRIFPNPFSESAVLQMTNEQISNSELKMFDTNGKEVKVQAIHNSEGFVIHRNNLPAGLYFYEVKGDGKIIANGKFIAR